MRASAAARRYARALFALAREDHRVSEIRDELSLLGQLLHDSQELREALLTPLYPVKQRKAVVLSVATQAGMSEVVRNFYAYLIDRRRLVDFAAIREEFERLADEASGLVTAQVTSAGPLDDRRKDRLQRALSQRTGREVRLEITVDEALIAGAVAKVGDLVFDGSIRTQLLQLQASLTKGS
jgi:F-type H+-transporting ATPase subunit delta